MLEPLVIAMHRFWHGIGSVLRFGHAVPMEWIFWCTQVAGRELLGQHLSGSKFLSFEYFELSSCGASCGAQTFALWLEAHSWSWFAACEGDPKFELNPHTFLLKSRQFQQLRPYLSGNSCPTWFPQGLAIVFLWWLVAWWPKQRGAESVRLEATKLWKTWFATAVGTQYPFSLRKQFLIFRLQTMQTSLGCCYLRNATWKMEKANRIQSKFIQKLHVSTDTSGNQIALLHNFGSNRFSPRAMKMMKRADIGWQVMTLSSIVTIETQVPSKTLYRPLANCWALCSRSARHFLFVDLERILLWCLLGIGHFPAC